MATAWRQYLIDTSNNTTNPNGNICAIQVARSLSVEHAVKYLHTIDDVKRAISSRYKLVNRTKLFDCDNYQLLRKEVRKTQYNSVFLVYITGHVMLLGSHGHAIVDTHQEHTMENNVVSVWEIFNK